MKCFKYVDLIGPDVKMTIQENKYFKSVTGGLFTILWVIISVLAFCAFGIDILEKKKPSIQLNTKDNPSRVYNYQSNNFTLMFSVTDNIKLQPIPDISRKMKLYFNVRNSNASSGSNLIDLNIDLVTCTKEMVDPDVHPNLLVNLSSYWCVPNEVYHNLINGLGEGTSQWFRIQMEICKNSTLNNNSCLPEDAIYKEFSVINVHYVLSDIFIDGYDYESPGKKTFISGLLKGGSDTWARTIFWYKSIFYDTDTSWILETTRSQNYFQNSQLEKEIYYQQRTRVFFSHLISIAKKADFYKRNYLKIQGVFAYIGGFITFFKIMFSFLNDIVNSQEILFIFFKYFTPKQKNNKSLDVLLKNNQSSNLELINNVGIVNLKIRKSTEKNIHDLSIKKSQEVNIKDKNLDYSLEDIRIFFLKYSFPCFIRKKSSSYHKYIKLIEINKKLKKKFSFENIIKMIRDIKILKNSLVLLHNNTNIERQQVN